MDILDSPWDSLSKELFLSGFQNDGPKPQWKNVAPMPEARRELSVAQIDEFRFLIVGGSDGGEGFSTTVHLYDTRTDAWLSLPDVRISQTGCGVAHCDGSVYLFGGWNYDRSTQSRCYLDTIERMDLNVAPLKWETLDRKVLAKTYCAVTVNKFIYVFPHYEREVFIFDTETFQLRTGPAMLKERTKCAVSLVEDRICVVGKCDVNVLTVDLYSGIPVDQWTPSPLRKKRYFPAVTAVGHCLLVGGGGTTVDVLDTKRFVWWSLPKTSVDRTAIL